MSILLNDSTTYLELTRYRGDGPITIPLTHPDTGNPFDPAGNTLIFTLKALQTDLDPAALVQKTSLVGGITLTNPSILSLVPADYAKLKPVITYEFDVQGQNDTTGVPLTVARGSIRFAYDITIELTTSIPTTIVGAPAASILTVQNRSAITGLASGGILDATKLGGQQTGTRATPVIPTGAVFLLNFPVTVNDGAGTHAGFLTMLFQLQAGTGATSAPIRFRPYDYDASANAVVWQLLSAAVDTVPASYNADTGKFHYIGAAGAANAVYSYVDQIGTAAPA